MMSRYTNMFAGLAARHEGALIPFLMCGDPDIETSLVRIETAIANGADALELGVPFSDPVADGPALVDAAQRALAGGVTPAACFALIARVRERHPSLPIGILVYANLVFARGVDDFHARAAAAGVDSILVPDVPLREAGPFRDAAARHGIDPVFILPPDTDDTTGAAIAAASRGYTYVLGRKGVTGAERTVETPPPERFAMLKQNGAPPVIGFGVSRPEHVRAAITAGAAGAIVGSALTDVFARGDDPGARLRALKAATRLR